MISSNKNVCSYVNNNTKFTKKIPQHLQRLMIKEYCKENKLIISAELLEYNNMDHIPILFYALENKKFKKIIIFSVQSINTNAQLIKKFIKKVNKYKKKIYFANESMQMNAQVIEKILKKLS